MDRLHSPTSPHSINQSPITLGVDYIDWWIDMELAKMKIKTCRVFPPIPIRDFDWSAIDEDTYDGAEDSSNRNMIGYGRTEAEAIADFNKLIEEEAEYKEELAAQESWENCLNIIDRDGLK